MEASELRIGNWILAVDDYFGRGTPSPIQIECIKDDGGGLQLNYYYQEGFGSESLSNTSGIELTEDWFLKFGFTKFKNANIFFIEWKDKKNALLFDLDDSGKATVTLTQTLFDKEVSVYLSPIQYVHQLQNIFYTLAGEELKLQEVLTDKK